MACPHCGNTAEPRQGLCVGCGSPLTTPTVATGVMTPPPPSLSGEDETRVLDAPPGGSMSGAAQRGTNPATLAAGGGATGPLSIGQNFGSRYHLIRLLGTGGMGAVYQAWDRTLEVAVAVKVIRPEPTQDPEAARALERRFKRELLLARQVTHPNVVRIHDLGEIDGITYITMPYVQGSDLATVLKRDGRMPVNRVLAIGKEIASGLAAAHKAGVVHRDLKPANIMVDLDGSALIMDFGIARSTATGPGMTMTAGGAVVGTIEYMAPEQARGVDVDQRADIYSFGLILHDLLLGHRKAHATTAVAELMERMLRPPAPVRSMDPAIPPGVDALITKCLHPDPAARFQTIPELIAELDRLDENGHPKLPGQSAITSPQVLTDAATPTMPSAPVTQAAAKTSRGKLLVLVASLLLVIGVGGFFLRGFLQRRPAPVGPTGPAISLAILPFRNNSGDPTLDSVGSSLSEVLRTCSDSPPRFARYRPIDCTRCSRICESPRARRLTPGGAPTGRGHDERATRPQGPYARFGDPIRIDATLQRSGRDEAHSLTAMAPRGQSPHRRA